MKNFKLHIEYDGSCYHGWQRQKNERTVQGEIENALWVMTGQRLTLIGSGRTDAGVHAYGQVANFHCDTGLTPEIFFKGLNSLLPEDLVVRGCEEVPESFHARFDATGKIYRYRILNHRHPAAIGRQYAWFVRKKLNIDAMRLATTHIIGSHDFKAFEGSGSPRSSTTRLVKRAELNEPKEHFLFFEIEAVGFLRYMVRNLVGSLVDVGLNKITVQDFKDILLSKNRDLAGITAPPQGLFLMKVTYK